MYRQSIAPGTGVLPVTARWTRPAALWALFVVAMPCWLRATTGGPVSQDTLTLAAALAEARGANPGLRAERLRAVAAGERVVPAGSWNDPELALGLTNRPIRRPGMVEPMTMNTVRVTQMVPWPGTRSRARLAARAWADADSLGAVETEAMLAAEVAAAYHRLAALDEALTIVRETRALLEGMRVVALARYGVGEAPQQDVLLAQVGVARMDADIIAMLGERVAMASRFNALLAREASAPVGALHLATKLPLMAPLDSLLAVAGHRGAIEAAGARIRAAGHALDQVRRERYPDLMLGVEYAQRSGYDDMASVMVGLRLPLFAGSRQGPMEREQEAMRAMQEASAQSVWNDTRAQLAATHAMAERARRLIALHDDGLLPQAQASVEAARTAYGVGTTDFMTLVESLMTLNQLRIDRIRLIADYHSARAELAALVGSTPEEAP